jgi:hypothetical protein
MAGAGHASRLATNGNISARVRELQEEAIAEKAIVKFGADVNGVPFARAAMTVGRVLRPSTRARASWGGGDVASLVRPKPTGATRVAQPPNGRTSEPTGARNRTACGVTRAQTD